MTVGSINGAGFARIEPVRALKSLGNNLHLLEVHNRAGVASLPSAPCRSAHTPGRHEQRAHADAISVSHDVLVAARDAATNSRARAALEKSLGHVGHSPEQPYGPRIMNQLTVLGAVLASARHAVQGAPDNKELVGCQRKLESAIAKIGLKAGLYEEGIPTGGYQGNKASLKVTGAIDDGQEAILACRRVMGDSKLLDGVVSAVLPGAMMQSLLERLPNVAASYEGRMQELDLMQVLQKQHADGTWSGVEQQMQTGCREAFANAVFALLKLPEYVLEREPASPDADKPPATDVPDGKFPPIPAMPSGGNQAINQTYVDNRDFGKALSSIADKLGSIANLTMKDAVALGMDLGRAEERVAFLTDENAGLRNRNTDLRNENAGLRNENKHLRDRMEDLDRKFDAIQERLNGWAGIRTGFDDKNDASSETDSGRESIVFGVHRHGSINPNENDVYDADLDTNVPARGAVSTERAEAGSGHGDYDPEADEIVARHEASRELSSKRGPGADTRSLVLEGAVQSSANLTAQVVSNAGTLANGLQTADPVDVPVVTSAHLEALANTSGGVVDAVHREPVDVDAARAIEQAKVDEIVFAGLEKDMAALRGREAQEGAQGASASATSNGPPRPVATQPEFRRSDSVRSVRELIARFDPAVRSPRSSSLEADESVDGRAISEHLASEQQVASPVNARARVQPSAIGGPLKGIREEFNKLVVFRAAQGQKVSAVKNGDPFREYWKDMGGLEFSPPVPPTPRDNQVPRIKSELEQVYDRLGANRARNSARPLKDVFPQRTPHGATMRGLVGSVDPGLHSNPVSVSDSTGESAATASVRAEPDDNATSHVAEPHVLAEKGMVNNSVEQLLKKYTVPVVNSFRAAT